MLRRVGGIARQPAPTERGAASFVSNQTQDTDANDINAASTMQTEDVCAICMDCIDTSKSITVDCGHKFHKSCLFEWSSTQLQGKSLNLFMPLKRKPDESVPILIHLDDTGLIKCACCRTEYTLIGTTDDDGDVIPKRVLAKIRFAEFNGARPVQYITDLKQFVWYLPKDSTSKVKFQMWCSVLTSLMAGVEKGTDTEIDAMFCNCNNKCCSGMFLLNKELWAITAKGGFNDEQLSAMNVFAIRHCVADPKVVEKMFNIKT